MKKKFKRIICCILISAVLVTSCVPSISVKASLPNGLYYVLTEIMAAAGCFSSLAQGEAEQGLQAFYEMLQADRVWNQGVTFEDFLLAQLHHNDETGQYTVDADLYNLIQEYIESLKTQTNNNGDPLLQQSADYYTMYLPPVEDAFTDNIETSALAGQMNPRRVLENPLAASHGAIVQYQSEQLSMFRNLYRSATEANTGYKPLGIFKLSPFFMGYTGKSSGAWSAGVEGTVTAMYLPETAPEYYIVGNFDNILNPSATHTYNLFFYGYDRSNNSIYNPAPYWSWANHYDNFFRHLILRDSLNFVDGADSAHNVVEYSRVYTGNQSDELYTDNGPHGHNGALAGVAEGFIDEWKYNAGSDVYYIPTWCSSEGRYIKVFKTVQDLQAFLNHGGTGNTTVDKSKHVKNVYITEDNHVEYNYYADDDPENPDNRPDPSDDPSGGGGSGSGIDYTAKLNEIILLLNQIREDINNLDTSGGSGTLQTSADLTQVLQELALIKAAIQNKEFTYTEAWSDEDINNLIDKIDDLLEDLGIIEEYLGDIQSDVYSSANALSSILRHVASIDAKLRLKGTIQDTDDNLDWLIELFQSLLENNASIPEEISEMLGTKFPFSLPYILVGILDLLEAPPKPPVFSMPLNWVIDDSDVMGDEEFTLDFTEFEDLANAIKFFIVLEWIMLLLKLTPKMLSNGSEIEDVKD